MARAQPNIAIRTTPTTRNGVSGCLVCRRMSDWTSGLSEVWPFISQMETSILVWPLECEIPSFSFLLPTLVSYALWAMPRRSCCSSPRSRSSSAGRTCRSGRTACGPCSPRNSSAGTPSVCGASAAMHTKCFLFFTVKFSAPGIGVTIDALRANSQCFPDFVNANMVLSRRVSRYWFRFRVRSSLVVWGCKDLRGVRIYVRYFNEEGSRIFFSRNAISNDVGSFPSVLNVWPWGSQMFLIGVHFFARLNRSS